MRAKELKKLLKDVPDNVVILINVNQRTDRGEFHVLGTSQSITIDGELNVNGPAFTIFPDITK